MKIDVSTLHTKILHRKLLKVLHKLTDFYFDEGSYKSICVKQFSAKWIS